MFLEIFNQLVQKSEKAIWKCTVLLVFNKSVKKCDFVSGFHFYYTVDVAYLSYQTNQEKTKTMQGTYTSIYSLDTDLLLMRKTKYKKLLEPCGLYVLCQFK